MSVIRNDALLTDLYQLSMVQGYLEQGMEETAVFEFFVRKLPPGRSFLVAAGLAQVIEYLRTLSFSGEALAWLESTGRFSSRLLDYLQNFSFTGDVHAMAEGTVFFADEPILRVTAPMPQAQLVESRLINLLHFQTLVATKAVRCVLAAPGKLLVDFGMRRAHGREAALLAARASYIAGFAGTSTVSAAAAFGIPVYGTMAHSFIQSHDDECQAFEHFARAQPGNVVLLIDTYDTERAAGKVVALAPRLAAAGIAIKAVRLDSGDLAMHARKVRRILDAGGCAEVRIFVSGNLDEHELRGLLEQGAPIDGFGIGTRLTTSADAPYLDCAYKLQEYAGRPRRKKSEGKATWPGRKQVFRRYDAHGRLAGDVLTLEDDDTPGRPLIEPVMRQGEALPGRPDLEAVREHTREELGRLPAPMHALEGGPAVVAEVSPALKSLVAEMESAPATFG